MTANTIKNLCWLEYEFAAVDAKLTDIGSALHQSAVDEPMLSDAALRIAKIKYAVRSVLALIDEPLSNAITLHETLEPAPF